MANQNTDKALLGFAMSSNSLLQKIEAIENQTKDTLFRIESVMVSSFSVTQGIAAGLSENNKILKEIKEIISRKSEAEKAKFGGGGGISKLLGLGGFIALTGIGMFGLAMAFQEAGKVTPAAIASGVAMFVALGVIARLMGMIITDPGGGSVFGSVKVMKTFTLTMGMSIVMLLGLSYALQAMAPVGGDKLITALALGAVIYIMGQTFVQLIKAWEFSGIMNFMLNKNNTDDIMRAMTLMSLQMVVLAAAMILMPSGLKQQDAFNFVIIAAAMIPLSVALVAMRFALPAIEKIKVSTIAKAGLAVAMLGLALAPVAMAAKLVGKVGITEAEIQRLVSISMALAPLIAIIGVMTALINFAKEGKVMKNQQGQNNSLLKMDNSRKRNQKMNIKAVGIFALQAVAVLAVLALTALAFKYAAPALLQAANTARQIDTIGILKFMFTIGGLLMIGGLVIGMTMKMLKGKKKSETRGLIPGMGSSSEKPGKLSKEDLIMAAVLLPLIAISMIGVAYVFKLLPPSVSDLPEGFLMFSIKAGIALMIFGAAMAMTFSIMRGKNKGPGSGTFGLGGKSKPASLSFEDAVIAAAMIPLVAIGVLATAWIFQGLPGTSAEMAPDVMWALKSAAAIMVFGGTLMILGKLAKNFKIEETLKVLLVVALASLSILMVATAFSLMAGIEYGTPPPLMWSVGVGVSLFIVGGVILALGAIAMAVTPAGVLLGALTVLVGAGVLYAVAWIFTQIGKIDGLKESAQTITDVLFMPFNAMVDLLKRFKEEIGVEVMGDLALGIVKIAGAWIVLSAALAGAGAAGVFASVGGVISGIADGITELFGGTVEMKPSELLKFLVENSAKVIVGATALEKVAAGYRSIISNSAGFASGMAPLGRFLERLSSKNGQLAVASFDKFNKSYRTYADTNNELDITKVEATTKMFNALADLAKNNGENAMKVLADSLLKAVAQLSDAVSDLDKAVDKQGEATSGAGDVISGAINKMKELVTGKTKEIAANTPGADTSLDDVVEAIEALEDTLTGSGIKLRGAAAY